MMLHGRKVQPEMKKPSSRIREEIARLQDQLKHAETREAERIGRIALKAGLGEIEIDEALLQAAFESVATGFREEREETKTGSNGKRGGGTAMSGIGQMAPDATGTAEGSRHKA